MPPEKVAGDYRARAGSLVLSYLSSTMGWDGLRAILAQAATGVELIDPDALVVPDRDEAVFDLFADRYLLEPANPGEGPDDVETPMRPTPAGREVPLVGATLHEWMERCPSGPIVETGERSAEALWPLLSGWVSTVVHAAAAGPRSGAEIREAVGVLDPELVAANIDLLGEAELLRSSPPSRPGGDERFEPTEWLRLAVAPLAVAARLELRHPRPDVAPLTAADIEAFLRLALPLLDMPRSPSGSCSLRAELGQGVIDGPVELTARVERGRVLACEPGADPRADARLTGSAAEWLDALVEGGDADMRSDGDRRLSGELLAGLHEALFG